MNKLVVEFIVIFNSKEDSRSYNRDINYSLNQYSIENTYKELEDSGRRSI